VNQKFSEIKYFARVYTVNNIKLTIIAKIRETHTLCSSRPCAVSVIMNTRCAWAGGSFILFTVFALANVIYFEEFIIHDSCGTESVGPVPFSAQYLMCRYVCTDRQTDRQTN
jgi:hypothetical protein